MSIKIAINEVEHLDKFVMAKQYVVCRLQKFYCFEN